MKKTKAHNCGKREKRRRFEAGIFRREIDTRKKNINALLMITLFFFSFPHTLASVCEAQEKNKTVAIQN